MSDKLRDGYVPRARYRREKPTKSIVDAFNVAIYGILETFYQERNMRVHLIVAFVVMTSALILSVGVRDLLWLGSAIAAVMIAEAFNTAVEMLVDMITMRQMPQARAIKDIAAGGVLLAVFYSIFVGFLVLLPKLKRGYLDLIGKLADKPEYLLIFAFFLPMIVVVLVKVYMSKGKKEVWEPLKGGVVSGHTALAFSLATFVSIISRNVSVALVSLLLALMVAQSRVEGGIHTEREALLGALIGVALGAMIGGVYLIINR